MKLEPIDTSTTAGKVEVMRMAAEGRKVATRHIYEGCQWSVVEPDDQPLWNWGNNDYAIIAEPVGPDEVFVLVGTYDLHSALVCKEDAAHLAPVHGSRIQRYIRADLAGEVE